MTPGKRQQLERLAMRVRERILRMSGNGGCFLGASLSCADIMVFLYGGGHLNISPSVLKNEERDIVLLSKGHDVPALYGTLAELSYFDADRLQNHLTTSDSIYWHPNRDIPGVEFHSGSLGHLLSVGAGMALDAKLRKSPARVIVILGDGELNEGSVWEAALVASAHHLDNLTIIVDRNEFQANVRTESLIPLESLERKFESFHWYVETIDGHSFDDIEGGYMRTLSQKGSPSAIVAQTVRGKGLPSMERRADRWFVNCTPAQIEELIAELHGEGTHEAQVVMEGLTVR